MFEKSCNTYSSEVIIFYFMIGICISGRSVT